MSKTLRYQEYAQEVERRKSQGEKVIYPQEGPQTRFLQTNADICIYGGAAGGGKTYGLLLTALRHISVPGFGYTIFRKNYKQIFNQGDLWLSRQPESDGGGRTRTPVEGKLED